jgi:mannose-6-phosphate isomerase-like protein (cupin superfamily)
MSMTTPDPDLAFARAYHELTLLMGATPALMQFGGWPLALPSPRPAHRIPAADILKDWTEGHCQATKPLRDAALDLADYADWQQTYSEAEVGRDFLDRYGYFELVGPTGHFHSDKIRAYIGYWGDNLDYDWHLHEAEELYYVIAGEALFEAEGVASQILRPGDVRIHASNQPHAMKTRASPILALILWRGPGLAGDSRMGRQ